MKSKDKVVKVTINACHSAYDICTYSDGCSERHYIANISYQVVMFINVYSDYYYVNIVNIVAKQFITIFYCACFAFRNWHPTGIFVLDISLEQRLL